MKILNLVEAAAAGVGRHVIDLSERLVAQGHRVHLIYSDVRADDVFTNDLSRLRSHVDFHACHVGMRRAPGVTDVSAAASIRRHLHRHGPFDVVHCHSTRAGMIGRLGLVNFPVKKLYSPHMFATMEPTRATLARLAVGLLEASLAKLCDAIIVVSPEEFQHALDLGIPSSKLRLIPNGTVLQGPSPVAIARDVVRQQWAVEDDEVCIGFVGRLVPQKSPVTALQSFAAFLACSNAPAKLIMIGDGPLMALCRRACAELGIERRVVWLGERDAKTLMHAFDILALTSTSEGHPIVVLEALARGLPIVATAVGGIADTVQEGVNGFVVPVHGVNQIAAALEVLVNNPALRERMGQASLARSRDFSVDRMVEQTMAVYQQVTSGTWSTHAAQEKEIAAAR